MIKMVVQGLDELRQQFQQAPGVLKRELTNTIGVSLAVLHENVPEYPVEDTDSTYDRTGQLGRSLGSSEGGGATGGMPDIYQIVENGGYTVGEFGTNLGYAPHVIGDGQQAAIHEGRWWTMRTIAERSVQKIEQLFRHMAEDLLKFIASKSV